MIKKRFEQYKKMYVVFVDFLLLLFPTFFFWIMWSREMNGLLYVVFKNKGNWLTVFCFVLILAVMLHAFRGFKIGYYKISSLIISQFLALAFTHVIMVIQIILMTGKVRTIRQIIAIMFGLFLLNWFVSTVITVLFTKLYNRLMPPYRLLHIYGDHKNDFRNKMAMRADKYIIESDMYIGEDLAEIEKEMLGYDGVILNDIPSIKKNVLLKYCFDNRIQVYFIPKISDIFVKESQEMDIFDTPVFLCQNVGLTIEQKIVKRIMDLIISCIVLVIASPIMIAVAIAIKIEDGGPIIYSQERCTLNGKCFMLHKFRSMCTGAEKTGGPQLARKRDTRITKVGRFIRTTRLDELPQLINVLRGEMSFVGPRPERPEFVEMNCKKIPEFQYRLKVKAGLTGYAQVFGKYNTSFLDKLKLDLLYIEKYSLLLDIQIILMTFKVILIKESTEGVDE